MGLLHTIDQTAIVQAIGAGLENTRGFCGSFFRCGTPMETKAGTAGLEKPDLEKARALLKESGYDGRPVVFMQPSDLAAGPDRRQQQGMPNALLWGLLAGAFRFVPYVGAILGALLPRRARVANMSHRTGRGDFWARGGQDGLSCNPLFVDDVVSTFPRQPRSAVQGRP